MKTPALFPLFLLLSAGCSAPPGPGHEAPGPRSSDPDSSASSSEATPAASPAGGLLPTADPSHEARRAAAHRRDLLRSTGHRDTHNLALDEAATGTPHASSAADNGDPVLALDGDPATGWRGKPGAGPWRWELPFRRVIHLGLLRFHTGDDAAHGTLAVFRWEYLPPASDGRCQPDAAWQTLVVHNDHDGYTFVHGPKEIHAQRQVFFADVDACGLRLHVDEAEGDQGPLVREISLYEGAVSVARGAEVEASSDAPTALVGPASAAAIVDGRYEGMWAGKPGEAGWAVQIRLPRAHLIDRLALRLGHDAVTVPRKDRPGRRFTGAYLPLDYRISTSYDDDPAHLVPLDEASPVWSAEGEIPTRRRLVRFLAPRPVKLVRITIPQATGPWGESDPQIAAPVIREVGLYEANDRRPVISEPLFLSVDANPAGLTEKLEGGSSSADGLFARSVYHRLRRVVLGFDTDSRWPADAARHRDQGTGRFLEAIEGDDPQLARPLLEAMQPPPVVLLSGSFDWDYEPETAPSAAKKGHWGWDVLAPARSPDRGMGQLASAVVGRSAPFIGFCGGAQILALLEGFGERPGIDLSTLDSLLLRNENRHIRGPQSRPTPREHAWWYDEPPLDALRPTVLFDPTDPLFNAPLDPLRDRSRELPSSHGDMIRASLFGTRLGRLKLAAESHLCSADVDPSGPEPTFPDPQNPGRRCVIVTQAFRSIDTLAYPVVGFQFHPEQRDLQRLAAGSPPEARGDALNVMANAIQLAIDGYLRLAWPDS